MEKKKKRKKKLSSSFHFYDVCNYVSAENKNHKYILHILTG